MPTYVVTGPGGKRYRVTAPSGASEQEVMDRVRNPSKPRDTRPTSFLRGVAEGGLKAWNNAARALEAGAEAIGIDRPVEALGQALGMAPDVVSAEATQRRSSARAPTRGSGVGRFTGELLGTIPATLATRNPFVQGALATGLLTDKRDPTQIAAEMAVGGALSKAGDVALRGVAGRVAQKKVAKSVPTVEDLKRQAGRLYEQAEKRGVTATKKQTQDLARRFKDAAINEGLITPTGRVSGAFPKAKEALDLTKDYARGTMTPKQMQIVRKTLSDAAGSADNSERRIGRAMLETFDDWTAPLAPELSDARAVSRRYINAEKLEDLRELAGSRAGQFTGSGFENALRTEYRNLDRSIIKGRERGFTPEAVQAIENVARGTRGSNIARNIGRLAPTGVVSGPLATGATFGVGTALGGPALGTGLAIGQNMLGAGGRALATDLGIRNATLAELIARQGGALPQAQQFITPEMQALISSMLATGAQSASREEINQQP